MDWKVSKKPMTKSRKALLVVDMINDFVLEDGALWVPDAKGIIPRIQGLIDEFMSKDDVVVFVQDFHGPDDEELKKYPPHAMVGTSGVHTIDELAIEDTETVFVVEKDCFDGFCQTDLDEDLIRLDVEEVVVVGTVTNICVFHTACAAKFNGFDTTVIKDACAGIDPTKDEAAFEHLDKVLGVRVV